jgi:hypothetical protein
MSDALRRALAAVSKDTRSTDIIIQALNVVDARFARAPAGVASIDLGEQDANLHLAQRIGVEAGEDRRRAGKDSTVKASLQSSALALVARQATVTKAVASAAAAMSVDGARGVTPREKKQIDALARRERMLAEMSRLEEEGRSREAPMLVARAFAVDRRDPIEVESLARSLRRWRKEKIGHCPVGGRKPS